MAKQEWNDHDRSNKYAMRDFAKNYLASCAPNAILITNGDNDTFPLWYLQDVEGVRRDVRVVILTLSNASWYLKELRGPAYYPEARPVPMSLSDHQIDAIAPIAWKAKRIDLPVPREAYQRYGVTDTATINQARISFMMHPTFHAGSTGGLRIQDQVVLSIIEANKWERPIYFSVTCVPENRIGLDRFLWFHGLAFRLEPHEVLQEERGIAPEILRKNLFDRPSGYSRTPQYGYKFRSIDNPNVYLDENTKGLLVNSRFAFVKLANYYANVEDNYPKAAEVLDLLKARKSDRGQIIVDNRTNTLIVTDTKDKIDIIEKMIEVLDTATPQVSIEARIVEATSNFVRNLGIQWGAKGVADPVYGNQTSLQFPNKVLVDGALIPQGNVTKGISGPLGGYAVNLPAPAFSSAVGFSFANVLDTLRLDVALTAMETNGNGQIVSSTKVTALNNKQAEVIQGRQIPVQTTANFTVTTQYVNAALQLRATPQITADNSIVMELDIQNNAADFGNLVNGIPPITTQSAKTQVMVPDGGTTVIGGISRLEDSITQERVPFLHQIPILGALFKNFARTKQNRELLIFITPRIIR